VKRALFLAVFILVGLLSGCGGSPHLLSYPFDPGGRSLNSPAAELSPQVAGEYVVFASNRFGRQDIYLFNLKTSSLVNLPGLNSFDAIASDPDLSADGRYIVFTGSRQGRVGIFLYDRETRQLRNLTANLAAEVRHPSISADGNRIAFESSANGQWDIFIYDRAGRPINVPMNPQ
jgi:Tol biopolymer transport system component